jgi:hypothetical protein
MTAKNVKYPGKLGKPFTIPDSEVMDALFADSGEKCATRIEKLEKRKEMELLLELLDHYEIRRDDASRWFHLARKLAITHVPAFRVSTRRPGRPRKLRAIAGRSLAEIGGMNKGNPGAPRTWTPKLYRELLELVGQICTDRDFRGRGAVTNALGFFISQYRKLAPPSTKEPRPDLNYLRKRYSEAKKKFPEMAR